jgi:hypothetical protein
MSWLKRKICQWLGVERFDDWGEEINDRREAVVSIGRTRNDAPTFFERNPETNFRIYNASGGIILEVGRWDKSRNEWTTNMHIIHDDEEHKTDSIAKIMTMELMR